MRVRLDPVFQKQLFLYLKKGKTWDQLAKELGTTSIVLKGCFFTGNTLSYELYSKLKDRIPDSCVFAYLSETWGQSKGGKNSPGTRIKLFQPVLDEKLAEVVGIMLGDGSNYANLSKGVYQIRIASNFHTEQKYLLDFMKPLFESLFKIPARIVSKPDEGVNYLCFNSKELSTFLVSIGVPSDKKKKSIAYIPEWIKNNESFLIACVRGLIDTDGSIHRLSRRDAHLLRISFTNYNLNLLNDTRNAFLQLGFHPSKIILNKKIFLTRKSDLVLFMEKIGFNNFKNQERFRLFSPVV